MKVCIIILNYNGFHDTIECIDGVLKYIDLAICEILVVDNGSEQDDIMHLRKFCGNNPVHLIETKKNLGYAGGNNAGIQYAINKGYEYVCILNNDTIVSEDFLTPCIDVLASKKEIGFVGPTIIDYKTNRIQSTGGSIDLLRGKVDLLNPGANAEEIRSKLQMIPCDYVGGACIIFRVNLIDKVGLIPENYFLFFEETEWCYRALRAGYHNYCLTDYSIVHKGSQSTGNYSGLQEYLMARNRVVFVKRNMKNPFKFTVFLLYILCGNIRRVFHDRKRFQPYFRYYLDGLFGRKDARYPFVIFKE